jgi:N-acyl-D-aspartate/D-glutamate deacylase
MLLLHSLILAALFPGANPAVQADFIIRGATIYDGSGQPGKVGDLAVKDDKIVAVGRFEVAGQPKIIDGMGLIAAPGFIDLHTHCDLGLTPITGKAGRANLCYLKQGVTTVVTGNCGSGPVDVAGYYKRLAAGGAGTNVIHQMPHNSIRAAVMGNANRDPSAQELKKMENLVERGMKDGAWGLSTGLIYNPGTYAKTPEIVALAKVAARYKGLYASHIRTEGTAVLGAIEEALAIGREAGVPIHISHLKASGPKAWGKSVDEIALIQKARARGQVVTADQYPYIASSTSLAATLVPARYREGSRKDYLARLDDAEQGPRMRAAIEQQIGFRKAGQAVRIAYYKPRPAWQGKTLSAIADLEKRSVLEIAVEIERNGGAQIINFGMSDEDMRLIMRQPFVATASDGSSLVPGPTVPHPRSYGCFPRKIGRFAIQDGLISVEQAIRSASGLPADILQLRDRGYLKPGYYADVVVFDPRTYRDRATFDKPHQYADGVRYLFVNGKAVIDEGKVTGVLAGKPLRKGEEKQKGRVQE